MPEDRNIKVSKAWRGKEENAGTLPAATAPRHRSKRGEEKKKISTGQPPKKYPRKTKTDFVQRT